MDQKRMGAFIAELRREKGWTQEELGERLGISNKTVSRWETGSYMPGVEMLSELSKLFGVSLNELLSGRRLEDESFRAAAEENLAAAMEQERKWFPRFRRWLQTHGGSFAVIVLLCIVTSMLMGYIRLYGQEHPVDGTLPGTFCYDPLMPGPQEFLIFSRDGETFYRYISSGEFVPLERGIYSANGEIVTVVTAERTYQLLFKGNWLYETDPDSGIIKKHRFCERASVFINIRIEDFESFPMPEIPGK